jgi:hypothetical protein
MKASSILTLLLSGAAMAQPAGTFTATGSMTAPRAGHSATLLGNGKVLIAGGSHFPPIAGDEVLASAELYDSSTGTFSLTASMSVPRTFHAAALLPDGKVLIAGGDGDGNGTADLYDPSTGLFSPLGSIGPTSSPQFATLLNNGKVLTAGGPFAALFDPSSATFTSLGPLPVNAAALTLLADGKVLMQGMDEAGFAGTALYDPDTGVLSLGGGPIMEPWTIVADALLASGKVLDTTVAADEAWPTGVAEFYDPSTKAFVSGKMAAFRRWVTVTLLPDSTVLIAGGGNSNVDWWYDATNGAEHYDPVADTFSLTSFVELVVTGRRQMATRADCGRTLERSHGDFDALPVRTACW